MPSGPGTERAMNRNRVRREPGVRAAAGVDAGGGWRTSGHSTVGPEEACVQVAGGALRADGVVHLNGSAGSPVVLGRVGHAGHGVPPPVAASAWLGRRPDLSQRESRGGETRGMSVTREAGTPPRPVPSSHRPNQLNDLTALTNLALIRHLRTASDGGAPADVSGHVDLLTPRQVEDLYERLPDWMRDAPLPAIADRIAQARLHGDAVLFPGAGDGFEFETTIELENVEHLAGEGQDIYNFTLAFHRDGITAKVDWGAFYVDARGVHYWSREQLQAAGGQLRERVSKPVIEFVSPVYPRSGDPSSRYNAERGIAALRRIDRRLMRRAEDGSRTPRLPIERLFRAEDGWTLMPGVAGAAVQAVFHPASSIGGEMLLHPQFTAAVETTEVDHWLRRTEQITRRTGADPDWIREDGAAFGRRIALRFVRHLGGTRVPDRALDLLDHVEDVAAIRNLMTLAYTNVAAVLAAAAGPGRYSKNYLLFALRTSLSGARRTLSPRARDFIEDNAEAIRRDLMAVFDHRYPRFRDDLLENLRSTRPRMRSQNVPRPLAVPLDIEGKQATVGDLLDNALLADPRIVLTQDEALGIYRHFADPEFRNGLGRVVGESRQIVPVGISGADEYLGRLERWLEEGHRRAAARHEFSTADGGWRADRLIESLGLLTDGSREGTAFSAVWESAGDLARWWRRVDDASELLSGGDMAEILVGLHTVGDSSEPARRAVTRAVAVVDGSRSRLNRLAAAENMPRSARLEARDALYHVNALRELLEPSVRVGPAAGGSSRAIAAPETRRRRDTYYSVLRIRLDAVVAQHLAEEVNAEVRRRLGDAADAPARFSDQQVVTAFRELPAVASGGASPRVVGLVTDRLLNGRPEAVYDPGPLPLYEASAGRHAHQLGAFERLRSSPDHWLRLAERHDWWDQAKFEGLRSRLGADSEDLAKLSLALSRIPHDIPAMAQLWQVSPTFLYGLSRSLNVDPRYLTGMVDALRSVFADYERNTAGSAEVFDTFERRLNGYVSEFQRRLGDHAPMDYSQLLMIAHFGVIDISRGIDDLVRFASYEGVEGRISITEMVHGLAPQQITTLADAWRGHEAASSQSPTPTPSRGGVPTSPAPPYTAAVTAGPAQPPGEAGRAAARESLSDADRRMAEGFDAWTADRTRHGHAQEPVALLNRAMRMVRDNGVLIEPLISSGWARRPLTGRSLGWQKAAVVAEYLRRGDEDGARTAAARLGTGTRRRADQAAGYSGAPPLVPARSPAPRAVARHRGAPRPGPEDAESSATGALAARAPHVEIDAQGTPWATPARSALDPDGNLYPPDQRACVNVAVLALRVDSRS